MDSELSATIEIEASPTLQKTGDHHRGFYISVRNPSAKALRDVSVYLTELRPRVPDLDWLPIPLHIKHDNQRPFRETFDMNPRGVRHVDLISHFVSERTFIIQHTVDGANCRVPIDTYILTVRAEGENIAQPAEAKFMAKLDHSGRLVSLPGAYIDLDKGLMELKKDADDALIRIFAAMEEITAVLEELTRRLNKMSVEIETPISPPEQFFGINSRIDRMRLMSPLWARRIDSSTEKFTKFAKLFSHEAETLTQNMTGYAELADAIPDSDLNSIRKVRDVLLDNEVAARSLYQTVIKNNKKILSTHIRRTMRPYGEALGAHIEALMNLNDGLKIILDLAEAKTPTGVDND
jgi:hypothetical protein